jgi:two-component system nitrate/nitrite response regulator NarL
LFVATTVLIVDDHVEFRAAARAWLEADGYHVVGEAGDGVSAMAEVDRLGPGVVLLDVQLPDISGFDVAEKLAEKDEPPVVVLVSSRNGSSYRKQLATTPARGFISKGDLTSARLASLVG